MNKFVMSAVILILSPLSKAVELERDWYMGASYGDSFSDAKDQYILEQLPKAKFGLLAGYQMNQWFSLEGGYTDHKNDTQRFCYLPSASDCVVWEKDYKYSFVGIRATKFLSRRFGFTARVATVFADYQSEVDGVRIDDSRSFNRIMPSYGVIFKLNDGYRVTLDTDWLRYPIGNGENESLWFLNLIVTRDF